MDLSIIIPTRNEQDNIKRLLVSIKNQQNKDYEIILVDNFSKDKTVAIAKPYVDKIIKAGKERSAQRNYGLKKARGKFVLFLDADMELSPGLLEECVQKCKADPKIVAIVIDEVAYGHSFLSRIKSLEKNLARGSVQIEAARFFRKSAVLKMGGYDKNLISGEDWDLSIRVSKLGPFCSIKSKIIHHENNTIWQDIQKKYYYAKSIQKYAKKHPEEFKKQAGFWRFFNLFKKPKIIYDNPAVFVGLLFLKSAQYLAYLLAKLNQK